ncbi:MAG: hypothetical protein HQK50_10210, partial [Oligoflexia bacterium]|nr:hypothetical protein [Oligoflexia bacterium]
MQLLKNFKLLNIPIEKVSEFSPHHYTYFPPSSFILKTCQRLLVLWVDQLEIHAIHPMPAKVLYLKGEKAYSFALEVVSGLQSPVVGEQEVSHQFKKCY